MNETLGVENQYTFLEYRKSQEKKHMGTIDKNDPLASILSVEVNTTEMCNRKCSFCPRHDPTVFANRNLHMSPWGAEIIASKLSEAFRGRVSLSGFGENLLNPRFPSIVNAFRKHQPDNVIECNTNGDKLSKDYVKKLFDNGLSFLYINLYDGIHQIERFEKIMEDYEVNTHYRYRMHWDGADHGLILNNRSGTIQWLGIDESSIESLQGKPCYYPFYKLFVDWNGDVLFCSNDWGREHVIGNLMNDDLQDVWFSQPMRAMRKKLASGDRSHSPCNKCSVNGTLFGKESFEIVQTYEANKTNRQIKRSSQSTD